MSDGKPNMSKAKYLFSVLAILCHGNRDA